MVTFTKRLLLRWAPMNSRGGATRQHAGTRRNHRHDTRPGAVRCTNSGLCVRILVASIAPAGLWAAPTGCAAPERSPPQRAEAPAAATDRPTTTAPATDSDARVPVPVERARWRDVDAAVRHAASNNELAVMRIESPAPNVRTYELIGARGEPGTMRVEVDAASLRDDVTIDPAAPSTRLNVSLGRFGDPRREARMTEGVRTWRPSHRR